MSITNILALLSGLALFLYGVTLMGDSLNRVAGGKLEAVLYRLTNRPIKGILLGTAVTAVVQSSTATSIIAIGFISSGMMQLSQAASIILGSILGTSITGWIVSLSFVGGGGSGIASVLSVANLTAILAILGIYLRKFSKKTSSNSVGTILLGFTILMTGMSAMSAAVSPLQESEAFISLLTKFSNPLLGFLVGMVFTAIIQSSAAAIGILQALSVTGAITFGSAYPIVLGVAVGGALPVLLSALGADINARRTAVMHLTIDILGAVLCGIIFYAVNAVVHFGFVDHTLNAVDIALVNTLFRLATVIMMTPCIKLLERIAMKLVPEKEIESDEPKAVELLLEERFLQYPALALAQCHTAIQDMANCAADSLSRCTDLLKDYSDHGFGEIEWLEKQCDTYEDGVSTYLMKASRGELTEAENQDVTLCLHALSDFERISDHTMNIAHVAKDVHAKSITYSETAQEELKVLQAATAENLSCAIRAFEGRNQGSAKQTAAISAVIENICEAMRDHHVDRLRAGTCTIEQGMSFNDIVSNYEEISVRCNKLAFMIMETAQNSADTHAYHQMLSASQQEDFNQAYEAYSEKYAV